MTDQTANVSRENELWQLARLFLRLGTTAFGGPAAHVAMMQDEVVRRRRWLTDQEFLDLLGATNLIPGPNSTELAIHIGRERAGWPGLVVAGLSFILPAASIVAAIAWLYVAYGSLPQAEALLYGVKPVIIVIVLQALYGLAKAAVKTTGLAVLAIAAIVATVLGIHELAVLFASGLLWMAWRNQQRQGVAAMFCGPLPFTPLLSTATGIAVAKPFGLWPLLLFFTKVGSVLFGSGYVLLAFLRADLVDRWHWITEAQLLDAIAVGQITPGPLFTTATFIGYLLSGGTGAVVATAGIFLPAFLFVAVSGPLIPSLRKSALAGAFLDGVNVASLALMSSVTWQLGRSALVDTVTMAIAAVAAVMLIRLRLNSAWLVIAGAAAGLLAYSTVHLK